MHNASYCDKFTKQSTLKCAVQTVKVRLKCPGTILKNLYPNERMLQGRRCYHTVRNSTKLGELSPHLTLILVIY